MTDEPDFRQWDRIDPLRLCDAAHLWVNQPPIPDPQITLEALPIWLWLNQEAKKNMLLLATMPITSITGDQFPYQWINRANLKAFAEQHGQRPAFLFPEMRKGRAPVSLVKPGGEPPDEAS